jgi:hypothetical protein
MASRSLALALVLVIGGGVGTWVLTQRAAAVRHAATPPHRAVGHSAARTAAARLTPASTVPVPVPTAHPSASTVSFATATGLVPPVPLQTAPDPADPAVLWAVEPEAIDNTLWFGVGTPRADSWRWIPVRWTGALPPTLPGPAELTLERAAALAPRAATLSAPEGWTLQSRPGLLALTVWWPEGPRSATYSGLTTCWTPQAVKAGAPAALSRTRATAPVVTGLLDQALPARCPSPQP